MYIFYYTNFASLLLIENLNINIIHDFFNLHILGPEQVANPCEFLSNSGAIDYNSGGSGGGNPTPPPPRPPKPAPLPGVN